MGDKDVQPSEKKEKAKVKTHSVKKDKPPTSEQMSAVAQDVAAVLGAEAVQEVPEAEVAEDATREDEDNRDVFQIYREQCLNCLHLTETGTQTYKKCYWENGNDYCPAKEVRIIVGVPVSRVAEILVQATMSGDAEKLSLTCAKLAEKDPSVQREVTLLFQKLLEEARASAQ
jgi:hypothetical protein